MQIQYLFEMIGTIGFAIAGAFAANDKTKLDWFGISFVAFITAIGGGSLRDVLLGSYPLVWIEDIYFLYAIGIGIIVSGVFYNFLSHNRKIILYLDTMAIALFTIAGVEKSLSLDAAPVVAAIMGMFSAVMGGVLRDTLTGYPSFVFSKEVYATACLAGAALYLVFAYFGMERLPNFLISGAVIMIIRLVAVRYNLSIPKFRS